jgi:prepilin-type N-terminal cleavage/methylation domain-containing protein
VIALLRRRDRSTGGDGGFTLTEMLVTISILGVVLAGVQTALIMTQRSVSDQAIRVDQVQEGRQAIESVTKNLRTAVLPSQLNGTCTSCNLAAFIQGTTTSVQFYANVNNVDNIVGPSRVTYAVNASNQLIETVQAPNAHAATDFNYQYCTPGTGGCVVRSRVLARNVVPGTQLFTYYDITGVSLGTATLDATKLALVDSVDVIISLQSSSASRIPPTTFTSRVNLPNADSITQPSPSP